MQPETMTNRNGLSDVTLVAQVFKTYNYSLFQFLEGNRDIVKPHIKRLQNSFQKEYLLNPIIVNENGGIVDGQNRFVAAKEEGLPIYYIMVEGYGLDQVQLLNMNQRNWNNKDYLESFVSLGYTDYLYFNKFWEMYPEFNFISILLLLLLASNDNNNSIAQSFKEGKFEIKNWEESKVFAERLKEIGLYYSGYNRTTFIRAIMSLYLNNQNFEYDEFIKKLKLGSKNHELQHYASIGHYKEAIEKIYNHKRQQGSKVTLRDL